MRWSICGITFWDRSNICKKEVYSVLSFTAMCPSLTYMGKKNSCQNTLHCFVCMRLPSSLFTTNSPPSSWLPRRCTAHREVFFRSSTKQKATSCDVFKAVTVVDGHSNPWCRRLQVPVNIKLIGGFSVFNVNTKCLSSKSYRLNKLRSMYKLGKWKD